MPQAGPSHFGPVPCPRPGACRLQSVTAEGLTNSAWSYLPDYGGWISNIFFQGPAWLDGVPACGTTRPGNPPNMD